MSQPPCPLRRFTDLDVEGCVLAHVPALVGELALPYAVMAAGIIALELAQRAAKTHALQGAEIHVFRHAPPLAVITVRAIVFTLVAAAALALVAIAVLVVAAALAWVIADKDAVGDARAVAEDALALVRVFAMAVVGGLKADSAS
jgi:hypothetical protein